MPLFNSPKILIRADALAQRYHQRPSDFFQVADPHAAWCIDEACAVAANLEFEKTQDDKESIIEGPSGRVDVREREGGSIKTLPGAGQVITGSFPVRWKD